MSMGILGGYWALKHGNVAFREDRFPKRPSTEIWGKKRANNFIGFLWKIDVLNGSVGKKCIWAENGAFRQD